jgi:hypothetical protein
MWRAKRTEKERIVQLGREVTMIIASLLFWDLLDTKPAPISADVYVGTHGPHRFLVDTGAETSLIDPRLAATLHLRPEFRVELLTQHTWYPG